MTTPTVEEIAGEIWRCIKEDFEKQGVQLPAKWNGIGLAYGGYVRAGEIMQKALDSRYEEGVRAERERINQEWLSLNLRNDNEENWNTELAKFGVFMQNNK